MGLAKIYSRAISGIDAPLVTVEVHVAGGLPSLSIVGLPDVEVKESRDRVRSAIQNSGFDFPARRITVNLAPADLPKASGRYDLPIALGILLASDLISAKVDLERLEFAGELALDGLLRPINGAMAMAHNAKSNSRGFILPRLSANEASIVPNCEIFMADSLFEVINHIEQNKTLEKVQNSLDNKFAFAYNCDFADVKGQIVAKKALEIAASGRHSILMIGNPGCGKSMLAERFVTILPPLAEKDALDVAAIHSLSSGHFNIKHLGKIPFRSPHHSSSSSAIVGGGAIPKPGEITLAHNGVLFLDEFPEFSRTTIEMLREPLENKRIHIARANKKVEFPADFQLIAAMNPCPCGLFGHRERICKCGPEQIVRYKNRISAPILDRIDLIIEVPHLKTEELIDKKPSETSNLIQERVLKSQELQMKRQGKLNYALNTEEINAICILDDNARALLLQITAKMGLSVRSYNRLLKVARTIADNANHRVITNVDVAEAIQYKKIL